MSLLKVLLQPLHQGADKRRTWRSGDVHPRQLITEHRGMCSSGHAAEQQNKWDRQLEEPRVVGGTAHDDGPGQAVLETEPGKGVNVDAVEVAGQGENEQEKP